MKEEAIVGLIHLHENAKRLPAAAKTLAISSYSNFLDKWGVIEQIEPKHWDFVMTIAGVFVAVSQLNHENVAHNHKDALLDEITNAAIEIYPDFVEASEDCRKFVDRTYDALQKDYKGNERFLFSDSLGSWIVWNLFGHAPSNEEERNLIRPLGVFIVHSFFSWWK